MGVETQDLPGVGSAQSVQPVNHVNIKIEERVPAGITVEGMFDEALRRFGIDPEGLCRRIDLSLFFHAGHPAEILRFQRRLDLRLDCITCIGIRRQSCSVFGL